MGHLLRRAGFGASPVEMDRYLDLGLERTLEYLIDYEKVDDSALEARLVSLDLDLEENPQDLQRWWLLRMVYTQRPLQEKMVLFWHGLLTSAFSKVGRGPRMYDQNQLFRTHALGPFDVLLKAISRDPAMLIWLDSRRNRKISPNENFARELMELFSMGEGTFSESDVREAARAFTGYFLTQEGFIFRDSQHDFGVKSFLGQSGPFDGDDIIDIIMEQPVTGEYISRRLFTFFVHDHPAPETVQRMADVFRKSGYSIRTVIRHLLSSEEFYSPESYRAKIKSPTELVAGTLRTLGTETDGKRLSGLMTQMGQTLFNPPDVSGWPGGTSWINSSTLLQRLNFAHLVTSSRALGTAFDSKQVLSKERERFGQAALEHFMTAFLDGRMHPEELEVLGSYIDLVDGRVALPGFSPPSKEQVMRSIAYLVMASPDYQVA